MKTLVGFLFQESSEITIGWQNEDRTYQFMYQGQGWHTSPKFTLTGDICTVLGEEREEDDLGIHGYTVRIISIQDSGANTAEYLRNLAAVLA